MRTHPDDLVKLSHAELLRRVQALECELEHFKVTMFADIDELDRISEGLKLQIGYPRKEKTLGQRLDEMLPGAFVSLGEEGAPPCPSKS